ncbi:UNVERIFIED_CONTAM: hypothetical protein Slati_2378800, partial [Sesamum latifolium]
DGCTIPIRGHPWLPRTLTFQLIGRQASLPDETKVSSLILPSHEWNEELIRAEFRPEDADCILSINLQGKETDQLIWHYEKNGKFSVRSAYRVACNLRDDATPSSSGDSWNFLWRSKAPPKVVMFAWHCASNALPTNDNLRHRGFARLAWATSGLPWGSLNCQVHSVEDWFRHVHRELGRQDWDLFISICGALWWRRNKRTSEGSGVEALEVIRLVGRMCDGTRTGAVLVVGGP